MSVDILGFIGNTQRQLYINTFIYRLICQNRPTHIEPETAQTNRSTEQSTNGLPTAYSTM